MSQSITARWWMCLFVVVSCLVGCPGPSAREPEARRSPMSDAVESATPAEQRAATDVTAPGMASQDATQLTNAQTAPMGKTEDKHSATADKPLCEGWDKPAVAIVLTGEQHGYIEPCGCTGGQLGGMSRRHDLVKKLAAREWPLTAFELGGTVKRNRQQSRIKFETMLTALQDMHYAAVSLGPEELRFGPDTFLQLQNPSPENPDLTPSFVSANVVFYQTPELGRMASKSVNVGGVTIGVTAVLSREEAKKATEQGTADGVEVKDPVEVLPEVVANLQAGSPDLLVLLSYGSLDFSRGLAETFPQFNLILSAGGPEDPAGQPEYVGSTMIVTVGHKGKYAGVVGFYPRADDPRHRLRFELVSLDEKRFDDSLAMVEHMRFYQERLKGEQIVAREHLDHALKHPSDASYVGAEKCGECHTKAYEKWLTTKHAHAFESLKHAREGATDYGISRVFDPECLACHVTGWHPQEVLRYEGGFINEEFARNDAQRELARLLQGQQCENCHGPGSKHIELVEAGELDDAMKQTHVSLETARNHLCFNCHDLDNSPHFEFDSYWEQIKHPWRD